MAHNIPPLISASPPPLCKQDSESTENILFTEESTTINSNNYVKLDNTDMQDDLRNTDPHLTDFLNISDTNKLNNEINVSEDSVNNNSKVEVVQFDEIVGNSGNSIACEQSREYDRVKNSEDSIVTFEHSEKYENKANFNGYYKQPDGYDSNIDFDDYKQSEKHKNNTDLDNYKQSEECDFDEEYKDTVCKNNKEHENNIEFICKEENTNSEYITQQLDSDDDEFGDWVDINGINSDTKTGEHVNLEHSSECMKPNTDYEQSEERENITSYTVTNSERTNVNVEPQLLDDYADEFGDWVDIHGESSETKTDTNMQLKNNDFGNASVRLYDDKDDSGVDEFCENNWNTLFDAPFLQDVVETDSVSMERKLKCNPIWNTLYNIERSPTYSFHWNKSVSNRVLLSALRIDSKNVILGFHWNSDVPRFAKNLGFSPLIPEKVTSLSPDTTQRNILDEKDTSSTSFSLNSNTEEKCELFNNFLWTSRTLSNKAEIALKNLPNLSVMEKEYIVFPNSECF